jgi:ATP-dependent Clp protease protease subunit
MIHVDCDPRVRWAKDGSVFQRPVEIHVTHFGDKAVRDFQDQLDAAVSSGQPIVPIFLSSYGGSIHGLLQMCDSLDAIRGSIGIRTIADGRAMSAAADLLSHGDPGLRFVAPSATVMMHDSIHAAFGKLADVRNDAAESARLHKLLMDRLDKNCGKKPGYWAKLLSDNNNVDLFFTPAEAVKHGLADAVGLPQMIVQIGVEFSYGVPSPHKHDASCGHAKPRRKKAKS